ncbi:hypothetical protein KIN20_019440 [Parelaphostrongylus tenuis]|uniref:Uncharacterized protein n=1 Tax=Parelaphostrongylus tenuis TaxID=148309 RepID=A0AAD5QQ81_PARTN|nr:hypothetical protein KIN20_019440 [Parelaphostrongylus tenuis]
MSLKESTRTAFTATHRGNEKRQASIEPTREISETRSTTCMRIRTDARAGMHTAK